MRPEVKQLCALGPLPPESTATSEELEQIEGCLRSIRVPLSNEEACALVSLFGPEDSCYGLAWTILHLIETAPDWPIDECLAAPANEWVQRLRDRAGKRSKV